MKLIENAGQAVKLWSVQVSIVGGAVAAWWLGLPLEQQTAYLSQFPNGPALVLLVTAVAQALARMKKQPSLEAEREAAIQARIDAAVTKALLDAKGGGSGDD